MLVKVPTSAIVSRRGCRVAQRWLFHGGSSSRIKRTSSGRGSVSRRVHSSTIRPSSTASRIRRPVRFPHRHRRPFQTHPPPSRNREKAPLLSLRVHASCSHTVGSSTVRNPACSIHKHTSLRGVGRIKVTVSKPGPKGSSVTLGHPRHRPDSRLGYSFHASRCVVGPAVSAVPVRHPQRLGAGRNGANVVLPRRNVAMENRCGEPSEFGIMGERHGGHPQRLDTIIRRTAGRVAFAEPMLPRHPLFKRSILTRRRTPSRSRRRRVSTSPAWPRKPARARRPRHRFRAIAATFPARPAN